MQTTPGSERDTRHRASKKAKNHEGPGHKAMKPTSSREAEGIPWQHQRGARGSPTQPNGGTLSGEGRSVSVSPRDVVTQALAGPSANMPFSIRYSAMPGEVAFRLLRPNCASSWACPPGLSPEYSRLLSYLQSTSSSLFGSSSFSHPAASPRTAPCRGAWTRLSGRCSGSRICD